jgi:hypothetical protein
MNDAPQPKGLTTADEPVYPIWQMYQVTQALAPSLLLGFLMLLGTTIISLATLPLGVPFGPLVAITAFVALPLALNALDNHLYPATTTIEKIFNKVTARLAALPPAPDQTTS